MYLFEYDSAKSKSGVFLSVHQAPFFFPFEFINVPNGSTS